MADRKEYTDLLNIDRKQSQEYFEKSIIKTEQHKFLEQLLADSFTNAPLHIADIACGGGTLSYHLAEKFAGSQFYLSDFSEFALETARSLNQGNRFHFVRDDIYSLSQFKASSMDLVFCWQTLSWIEEAKVAVDQLIRITKPGGKIYCSSLFNLNRDVDVFARVLDHTRESSKNELTYAYYTYSAKTVVEWIRLNDKVSVFKLHAFNPVIPFAYDGRGLGTSTIKTADGQYLQVSGGMLMNWAILEIELKENHE
jgi:ubiquinone/menaquinone biosynthesis C-methylase UbiE